MKWLCWIFHKWSKYGTPYISKGEHYCFRFPTLIQDRHCDRCGKVEYRIIDN